MLVCLLYGGLLAGLYPQARGASFLYVKYYIYTHSLTYYAIAEDYMAKLTTQRIDALTAKIMDGHSLARACTELKISRANIYSRMAEDADLERQIRVAQQQSAEKAVEELDELYQQRLRGEKDYDPNVLRDYATHVRWKVGKLMPDRFGDQKNRAGVEIGDGTVKIVWETDAS